MIQYTAHMYLEIELWTLTSISYSKMSSSSLHFVLFISIVCGKFWNCCFSLRNKKNVLAYNLFLILPL